MDNKCIGYTRVSTVDQADKGASMEAQAERIRQYCKLHHLDLIGVIEDNGISGGKPLASREGGRAVLKALATGEARNVVVTLLDRAFRSTTDALKHIEAWNKQDVGFHVIDLGGDQSLNTRSATGQFVMTVMAALGQLERDITGERTRAVLQHKKEHGQVYGAVPYGYKRDNGNLVKDPGEQKVLTRIKRLRRQGTSYDKIVTRLNGDGIPGKRGGQWNKYGLWYLLNKTLPGIGVSAI